ncbi:unnamed protein product [Microthlaspi erraticum]|uniref:Tf2-1-like SH3-like domain-containing protein n=1 Tax=Microthlaspi erraticum TaxID=1685480 RepID=A0A6D2HXL6_9BRAS|nr:unnamed protein product [Microthlaspi erraticum]
MKQTADKKRRHVEFNVGDWVFLRLQPYRQHTIFRRTSKKLSTKYHGPFQVEAIIRYVAYSLSIPEGAKVHHVFHVSLFKKLVGNGDLVMESLPPIKGNGNLRLELDQALEHWQVQEGQQKRPETLVKWRDLPLNDATWEETEQLHMSFPTLNLEDKLHFGEESNDGVQEPITRTSNKTKKPNLKYVH